MRSQCSGDEEIIKKHLAELGYPCKDYGSTDPIYANVALEVSEAVAAGKHWRESLCGTGIGMSIAANSSAGSLRGTGIGHLLAAGASRGNNNNIYYLGRLRSWPGTGQRRLVEVWVKANTPRAAFDPKVKRIYAIEEAMAEEKGNSLDTKTGRKAKLEAAALGIEATLCA